MLSSTDGDALATAAAVMSAQARTAKARTEPAAEPEPKPDPEPRFDYRAERENLAQIDSALKLLERRRGIGPNAR
jgi:hypothetical protein